MSENSGDSALATGRAPDGLPQWPDYLTILAEAAGNLERLADPVDPLLRQETYRLLALSIAQGYLSTFADPNCPDFVPAVNNIFNAASTNPDFIYYQSSVNGEGVYRISGYRGEALFVLFDMSAGGIGVMDELGPSTGQFEIDDLQMDSDGRFEVILSAEKPVDYQGNWQYMDRTTTSLSVRQAAYHWGRGQDGRFAIERIDQPLQAPVFDAQQIARRLQRLMAHPKRFAGMWLGHMASQRAKGLYNDFELDDWAGRGGVAGQYYYQGLFKLTPGEVLLLETELPETCLYWNVQLSDPLWNSIDWINRQSSLNGSQAHIDSDGKFRAVIATEDPGVPNWLDPGQFSEGAIMLRWTKSNSGPRPALRSVPFNELRAVLPAGTPAISTAQRQISLADRRRGAQLRRRW
jgi:hypothetical protein